MWGISNVALAFVLCSCCFQACGGGGWFGTVAVVFGLCSFVGA